MMNKNVKNRLQNPGWHCECGDNHELCIEVDISFIKGDAWHSIEYRADSSNTEMRMSQTGIC